MSRVLHVISGLSAQHGGTAMALAALARAQKEAGLSVAIVTTFVDPPDNTAASLREAGIEVIEIGPCKPLLHRHPAITPTLREQIARAKVVHIHALWEEVQHRAAKTAKSLGVPYLFTPHGMLDPWSLSQSRLKKQIYLALRLRSDLNSASAIHFTSEIERNLASPLQLTPPTIVEPNGVDLSEFASLPPRGGLRSRFPRLGDRPIVLFLSRVHPKKGLDLLIPAFAKSAASDAILVIAGPDSDGYANVVREMAAKAGVADRVIFTGMLRGRERVEAYIDADLFVLPSYQENFGIVVIEALASGCPVIISDQVNIHPEITAANVGEVVPTQADPLADALRRWMSDAGRRRAAGERGPAFVRQRYDWREIARRWLSHYTSLATAGKHA
jgi:glycosyltransferase involved in cell wall biosynthesis